MMIDPGWKVRNLHRRSACARLSLPVLETDERILVRNVKLVSDQRHAVRRVQVFGEDGVFFVDSVSVFVPQQGQAVAARDVAYPSGFYDSGNEVLWRQDWVVSPSSFNFEVGSDSRYGI